MDGDFQAIATPSKNGWYKLSLWNLVVIWAIRNRKSGKSNERKNYKVEAIVGIICQTRITLTIGSPISSQNAQRTKIEKNTEIKRRTKIGGRSMSKGEKRKKREPTGTISKTKTTPTTRDHSSNLRRRTKMKNKRRSRDKRRNKGNRLSSGKRSRKRDTNSTDKSNRNKIRESSRTAANRDSTFLREPKSPSQTITPLSMSTAASHKLSSRKQQRSGASKSIQTSLQKLLDWALKREPRKQLRPRRWAARRIFCLLLSRGGNTIDSYGSGKGGRPRVW